ncbi:hypothetical protein Poly24_35200 [Rosistilla carotiformis]|uniref:Glycosyltransferase RgtA/B/C/D-like domain-containing protein n=1 Tax=Rosistilla carotiformis TaxID=2528017 RepID=A0A518JW99_9BACT|nr:hypothetical protein [Rosistilla carotiformis]QDV69803.1 hypothetical protein Poly24_35200 [Rosistilla carotiformis]
MTETDGANDRQMRRMVYLLLTIIATAMVGGRIAVVQSSTGEVPFLSANDRSRWCTISALVDDGTYAIDRQINYREPVRKRRVWYSIDLVRHRGADGEQHYYSSKPPLYPTMLAGVYAAFRALTGASLFADPFYVGRWLLAITNLLPMIGYFAIMLSLIERFGKTNYGRLLAATAVTCGTLLVPFAISLSNHLPAAISSAVALVCVLAIGDRRGSLWLGFVAGLAGGFAAANELPALSMTCLWGALLLLSGGLRATSMYALGLLVVAVAFFGTNYYAHGSWRPPYMHRGNGPMIARIDAGAETPDVAMVRSALIEAEGDAVEAVSEQTPLEILETTKPHLIEVWLPETQQRYALTRDDAGWKLSHWDDWYEYPGTYWQPRYRTGVDKGEQSRGLYAFHATWGHHGIFSLTPIWVLSIIGCGMWVRSGSVCYRNMSLAIGLATLVCFAFYIARPLIDRNYGGVSCAFRWMLWFIPLWIWLLLPAADWIAKHPLGRGLGYVLLAVGLFSVVCSLENPWQHPWIYRYWDNLGWLSY